jgi:hypothetical protein
MIRQLHSIFLVLRQQGWWVLVAALLIGGALMAFAELADEVADGETHAFDRAVMLAMREPNDHENPLGPAWLEMVARDVTSLGGTTVLALVTLATIGFMLLRRKWGGAIFVLVSVAGGTLISSARHGLPSAERKARRRSATSAGCALIRSARKASSSLP